MLKVGICFLAVQAVTFLLLYPLIIAGKREDEQMQLLFEKKRKEESRKELEDKMESQRDVLRMVEKEISKGSAPVRFAGMGFTEDTYHLVESNVYMDAFGKKLNFRSAISELDRRNMEVSAKRWIKKKHPSFDGDVYVENVRCFL